jgi:hypothetical protein
MLAGTLAEKAQLAHLFAFSAQLAERQLTEHDETELDAVAVDANAPFSSAAVSLRNPQRLFIQQRSWCARWWGWFEGDGHDAPTSGQRCSC